MEYIVYIFTLNISYMTTKNTQHYHLIFHDNYVIAEANNGVHINNDSVASTLKIIFDHYNGKDFALISHRKNQYTVDIDVYSLRLMKKLRALAIVSSDSSVKEKAIIEQLAFDKSFAFFENLEEAKGWAESVAI